MAQVSYPGVYVEEIPSGVRTITGVSTSVTAFIGYTPKGPIDKAVRVFDYGSYEREFGGLAKSSELGYAVQQFFLNGGSEAWVVRVAAGAAKAALTLKSVVGAVKALTLEATSEGTWGNLLRVDVDYDTTNPDGSFNLSVSEYTKDGTDLVLKRSETHLNLTMDEDSSGYAPNVINAASELVTAERHTAADAALSTLSPGWSLSGDISSITLPGDLDDTKRFISIIVDGDGPHEVPIFSAGAPPASVNALVTALQDAIRGISPGLKPFQNFTVERASALGVSAALGNYLLFTADTATANLEHSSVQILNASSNSASKELKLGLANGGRERPAAADLRPTQTGTVSDDLADKSKTDLSGINGSDQINISVKDGTTVLYDQDFTLSGEISSVETLDDVADLMQKRIRAIDPNADVFSKATVDAVGTRLRVVMGTDKTDATVELTNTGGGSAAGDLRINTGTTSENVQRYSMGVGVDRAAQVDAVDGANGTPPNVTLLKGKLADKTGMYALEDVDIFNILCIPRMAELGETNALSLISEAAEYCENNRAFLIVDPPKSKTTVKSIQDWATKKITPNNYSAVYYPFIKLADPLDEYRLKDFPPSGTMAGLYARTDASRGVWKAPAGTEATLINVQGLAYTLTDMENGVLNKLGVNCLRQFPVYGRVSWGARTLEGADQKASEWKYIPVRRLALFIEESLFRGTQWVVFEPNDAPLWAQIRLNVGAFMHNLFRQGAFQGQTPQEAYFVKCDKETTTQNDINRGIVNILVGFAPLKPAEFVIIKIQQIAGQIET